MRAQTLSDSRQMGMMAGQRSMEINPRHPIVHELNKRVSLAFLEEKWLSFDLFGGVFCYADVSAVLSLVDQIEEDPESEDVKDMSWLLYDSAITASGFQVCFKRLWLYIGGL